VSLVDNVTNLSIGVVGTHTGILAGANILVSNSVNVAVDAAVTSSNGNISVLAANMVTQNANILVSSGSGSIDVEGRQDR